MRWFALALLLPLAAGCLDDASTASDDASLPESSIGVPPPPAPPAAPATPGPAGSDARPVGGDPHGEPEVQEGPTEARLDALGWVATRTVTVENGVADAVAADVGIGIGAGSIVASGDGTGSYAYTIVLEARGTTEEEARQQVEATKVVHEDALANGRLTLSTRVEVPPPPPPLLGVVGLGISMVSADVTASLPRHLAYELGADAGSGAVTATALAGPRLSIDTGSGSIRAEATNFVTTSLNAGSGTITVQDGLGRTLVVGTGSGSQDVQGRFDTVEMDSGSGSQSAVLSATASGRYAFDAGSGSVSVRIGRVAGQALDVEAENGSGSIDVQVSDGEPVGDQDEDHVHVRSRGYEDAAVQTRVEASTGSGSISVSDA